MTNSELLREKIESGGLKYKYIAEQLEISPYSLQKKIDNLTEFKASEITRISSILNLPLKEKDAIFFACDVELNATN